MAAWSTTMAPTQFQADLRGVPVVRPAVAETTASARPTRAGLAVGDWDTLDDLRRNWQVATPGVPRWLRSNVPSCIAAGRRPCSGRCTGWTTDDRRMTEDGANPRRPSSVVRRHRPHEAPMNPNFDVLIIGGGANGWRNCAGSGAAWAAGGVGRACRSDRRHFGPLSRAAPFGRPLRRARSRVARECIEENRLCRRIVPHGIEDTGGLFIQTPDDDPAYAEKWVVACRVRYRDGGDQPRGLSSKSRC